jgi:hypothetical protein
VQAIRREVAIKEQLNDRPLMSGVLMETVPTYGIAEADVRDVGKRLG